MSTETIFEQQFRSMRIGYAESGGLAYGDEVARLMRDVCEQPVSAIARAIVARRVVSFEWHCERLLPLFQFDAQDMSAHPGTVQIVRELGNVFDDWEMALWFAQPNSWLHDEVPANLVRLDLAAVLRAARADRYIAHG